MFEHVWMNLPRFVVVKGASKKTVKLDRDITSLPGTDTAAD